MQKAYIGLGGNLGDRLSYLARAVDMLADMPESHVVAVSKAYESEPWGVTDQPPFANAVAVVETNLEPEQLLDLVRQIEVDLGREEADIPFGPRVIDLDILLLGETDMSTPDLVIPHPRMAERDFVITPLLEIAPDVTLPDGTPFDRSAAVEGKVIGELGCVPDWGEQHNEPVYANDWVVIAESEMAQNVAAGFDPSLQFKREVLEQAEIPFSWDPYEPGATENPWGAYTVYKMLVPRQDAERAASLLAEAMAAQPEFPEDLGQTEYEADAAEEAAEQAAAAEAAAESAGDETDSKR